MLHYGWFGDLLPNNTLHSKYSRSWLFYHQKKFLLNSESWQIFALFSLLNVFSSTKSMLIDHRRFRPIYLSSHPWKNYPNASEGSFGFSWIMLSNDAKIRACFTTFLAATAPRSEAVFSTWKLVSASNRKAKIIYFVPYEGSWTSPRGALRYLWVLVKLWDPHRTLHGAPRDPLRVP